MKNFVLAGVEDARYGKLFKVKAENSSTAKIEMLPEHCIIDSEVPDWGSDTNWPPSALNILKGGSDVY